MEGTVLRASVDPRSRCASYGGTRLPRLPRMLCGKPGPSSRSASISYPFRVCRGHLGISGPH